MPGLQPGDIIPEALSWEKFELHMLGAEVINFSGFEVGSEAEIAINQGKGGEGVSYSKKSYKRTAKATIYAEELMRMIRLAAPYGGDLLKLPPMPLTAKCEVDSFIYRLRYPAVLIAKYDQSFKQGDDKIEVPMDLSVVSYPIATVE